MNDKILLVSPTAVLGGAERNLFNIALHYLENGNIVYFYIMSKGDAVGWDELKKYKNFNFVLNNNSSEKTALIPTVLKIFKLCRKHDFKFVFSSHTHINGLLSLMRKFKLLKCHKLISRESTVVFDRYKGIIGLIFKMIYRFAYGRQDLLICQTNYMKSSLIKNLGYRPVKVIEHLSNPVSFNYITKVLDENEKVILDLNKINLVACGRFVKLKQFDVLLKVYSRIVEVHKNTKLTLIGDGPEVSNLKRMVSDLNLKSDVIFTGKIENPFSYFKYADIGIICSSVEGFPNVLNEMMYSGVKKIVVTPCTDGLNEIPDITITDDIFEESIYKALNDSIVENKDFSLKYREFIEENRSINSYLRSIDKILF